MAIENKDVIRVEATQANLLSTLRNQMIGWASDEGAMYYKTGGALYPIGNDYSDLTDGFLPMWSDTLSSFEDSDMYSDGTQTGVGTSSPQAKLHVAGNILLQNDGTIGTPEYTNLFTLSDSTAIFTGNILTSDSSSIGCVSDPDLLQLTDSTALVNGSIKTDTEAHIGSVLDPDLLRLGNGNLYLNGHLWITGDINSSSSLYIGTSGSNNLIFRTEGTNRMTVRYNGDVGIGTISPTSNLHIRDTTDTTLKLEGTTGGNVGSFKLGGFDPYYAAIGTETAHPFYIFTDTTFQHIFNTDGEVGINTLVPSETLDVDGNARFRSIGSGTSAGALHYESNGTLTTSTSDRSLKKDITKIEKALEKITDLRGVYFRWKESKDNALKIGMIAQETEKIVPELVFTSDSGLKGIHYDVIPAILIEGIKELSSRLQALEEHYGDLHHRLRVLEGV